MDLKEAASLLGWKKDDVACAINVGVKLPHSENTIKLSVAVDDPIDITEEALDEFIEAFERLEPSRHPPVAVRRELRTECGHRCAICSSDLPLQFHHILEWHKLKHHDPHHMLAICGGCHDKIGAGQIDAKEQRIYKQKTRERFDRGLARAGKSNLFDTVPTSAMLWDDIHAVVSAMHATLVGEEGTSESQFDLSDVDLNRKNELNGLGADTFAAMIETDEPFFNRIQSFLGDPRNADDTKLYHETVDEIRRQIAARQDAFDRFDDVLLHIANAVIERHGPAIRGKRRELRILVSFMYINCDIGRKS